jgi:bifunctional oligoribonuclease and PAP phosphatase NrnA
MNELFDQSISTIRQAESLLLMTHEHPDGDAIGSLVAMHRLLTQAGLDAPMLISDGDDPAAEYMSMVDWGKVVRVPEQLGPGVTLVLLDCGNYERSPIKDLDPAGATVINIDHHHDNTRFGSINVVDPDASCTAELVWRIAERLGAEIDLETAHALYAGLITDTGRFMYSNTGPEAHRMAADLISKGVEVERMYRRIYEGIEEGKVRLLARALSGLERFDDGSLSLVWLDRDAFDQLDASDDWTEGIVDYIRAIEGTAVAAVVREPAGDPQNRRISLRASLEGVDVSLIAREGGGGGHKGAAGFSSRLDRHELIEFLRAHVTAQIGSHKPA